MVAWVLNLDAEDELASPRGAHTPSPAMRARIAALVPRLAGLVAAGDVVLDYGVADAGAGEAGVARGHVGGAWCPTPRARERLARAGATLSPAPSFDVLRAVNDRAFCAALGQTLDGAAFETTAAAAIEQLERARGAWLLKRPFGFAGRGRRPVRGGALGDDDRAWIAASMRDQGGLQIEPRVTIDRDFAIHGALDASGVVRLGTPTVQRCDERGAWVETRLAAPPDLAADEERALLAEATRAASALRAAGYFGPFGVDAFRYRDAPGGALRFNPRSEINARYSMGWAIGMRQGQKQT
jgi:hypothetical protein